MVASRFLSYFALEDRIGLDGLDGFSGKYKVVGIEA